MHFLKIIALLGLGFLTILWITIPSAAAFGQDLSDSNCHFVDVVVVRLVIIVPVVTTVVVIAIEESSAVEHVGAHRSV